MNKEFCLKKKFVAIALKIFLTVCFFFQKPCLISISDSMEILTSIEME